MKSRWGLIAALALVAVPGHAQVKLTPENSDRIRQVGGEILFWNQEQRDKNFPAMETLFPGTVAKAPRRPKTPAEIEAKKKEEQLEKLKEDIRNAKEVKTFDPKARYRVGEIVSHAEWGRGKVENVLRSSVLVRFPAYGLRSIMLL